MPARFYPLFLTAVSFYGRATRCADEDAVHSGRRPHKLTSRDQGCCETLRWPSEHIIAVLPHVSGGFLVFIEILKPSRCHETPFCAYRWARDTSACHVR